MKTKAYILFEPMNHVMKVIEAAKRAGLHVIAFRTVPLTTIQPYAAAAKHIDTDVVVDNWTDTDALIPMVDNVCKDYEIVGSYAAAEGALYFESVIRQRYDLPGLSPEKVEFLLNKEAVRNRLFEKGLTRLTAISQEEALRMSEWPPGKVYFFKPANGAGSALVRRCASFEDLQLAISNWREKPEIKIPWLRQYIEGKNRFFLEQAAEGLLLSVEGFVVNGEYFPIGVSSRTLLRRDNTVELGLCFPYHHPQEAAIIDKVRAIHSALHVNNGPTHTEVIFTNDGAVELVELNIRFVGADGVLAINAALGIQVEDDIVRTTVGEKPSTTHLPEASRVAAFQMIMPPLDLKVIDSMEFPTELVEFHRIIFPLGTALHSTRFQTDQIGSFVVRADTYPQLLQLANFVRENIKVNGQPLGRNINNVVDIY